MLEINAQLNCSYLPYFKALLTSATFTPLSMSLTLADVTRSAESKTSWVHIFAHFGTDQDEMLSTLKQFKLNMLIFLQMIFMYPGKIFAVLLSASKNLT